jgi:hypothetical protein
VTEGDGAGLGRLVVGEDLAEVVDAGGLRKRSRLWRQLGVDVALDDQGEGESELAVAEPDLELGEVLGSVAELCRPSHQSGVNLVLVALLCRARHSRAYAEFRIMPSKRPGGARSEFAAEHDGSE